MNRYNRTINGYKLEVIRESDGYYAAKLTNTVSGATRYSDGWSSRDTALWIVRQMHEEQVAKAHN